MNDTTCSKIHNGETHSNNSLVFDQVLLYDFSAKMDAKCAQKEIKMA